MLRLVLRVAVYVLILVVFVGGVGSYGAARLRTESGYVYDKPIPALQGVKIPEHNPNKPTVAVLLGNAPTESFDFLTPYDLFSRTEAFNVYAVASDTHVRTLTGGLEVVPHYSFDELDALLGKSPDLIVIPNLIVGDRVGYERVLTWIQKHGETSLLSICFGSQNLADTGLLKGKKAATHWYTLATAKQKHPDTQWIKDQRYVVDGNVVSSAGLSAGIDAILYVISQRLGEPAAVKTATAINYPSYEFVHNPKMEPHEFDFRDATRTLNIGFQLNKDKAGVLLYNGMEELALASIVDTFSGTTGKLFTVSSAKQDQTIVTAHGLNLFARYQMSNAPKLDRMIVPGAQAKSLAAADVKLWNETGRGDQLVLLHSDSPDRYVFEAPLEDLARREDVLTAKHAVKRLEYRAGHVKLEGMPFSIEVYSILFVTVVLALLTAFIIDRRLIMPRLRLQRERSQAKS